MLSWSPFWNDTVKIESGGRYPLLLNRFHDHMEDFLIKAIVSTTDRLRYISYCCWAIGDIEDMLNCKKYSDFVEAFRRRENAFAIGSYLLKPDVSTHGSYKVYGRNTLKNFVTNENQDYNCSFKLMKSANLGAYELYYSGTIFNWGLVWQDENGVIKLTENGRKLYNIVRRYYKNSLYYKKYKGESIVPGNILKEWANVNNYDSITDDFCSEEREFYKKIIFRLDDLQKSDLRRDTFAFFLECIKQCSKNGVSFDEDVLRNIHYYGVYYDGYGKIKKFFVPDYFEDVVFYWMIYEIHVYFRWWISEYLRYFLTVLKSKENGMTIDEFFETIDIENFNKVATKYTFKPMDYYNSELSVVLDLIKYPTKIDDSFSEETITEAREIISSGDLAKVVLMIVGLYRKYQSINKDQRYLWIRGKLMDDFWSDELFLEFNNLKSMKVSDFLKYLLKKYIIAKHDYRMYEKQDLRRCWFTKENKRYIFQADESPIWRPAKFKTILSFLLDMRLIEYSGDILILTKDGTDFYQYLKREFYK